MGDDEAPTSAVTSASLAPPVLASPLAGPVTAIRERSKTALLATLLLFGGPFCGQCGQAFWLTTGDVDRAATFERLGVLAGLVGLAVLVGLVLRSLRSWPQISARLAGAIARRNTRRARFVSGGAFGLAVLLFALGRTAFHSVEPGKMLVVKSNVGDDPPAGQILAQPGQKGVLEDVLGEGLHFVPPIFYEVERHDCVDIPPGMVGVVTARAGREPPAQQILVSRGEKGVWREVLPPGRYRMNPYAFAIEPKPCVLVRPGFVGFVTSLVGTDSSDRFAGPGQKGMRRDVLEPGIYYLNPYAERVDEVEVGINQVSFLDEHVITFPSADAFEIQLDATVEWELHPEDVAEVVAELGVKAKTIEENVIVPQAKSIGRLSGSLFGAKEFLLGEGREKFQRAFTDELVNVCKAKHLDIHSAFIRHITIPPPLLKPIQEAFVSVEKQKTAVVWEDTRKSAAELEREQALIAQRMQEVTAQTDALVATIDASASQEVGKIQAEMRREIAVKQQAIAQLDAERTRLLGSARADVQKKLSDAHAGLFALELQAFQGDTEAFRRHAFAEALPGDFAMRLVQSGQGTLWTDLLGTAGVDDLAKLKLVKGH